MPPQIDEVYESLGQFPPNSMQRRVWEEFAKECPKYSPAFLLQGATGSGKTEAIVFPSLAFQRRLLLVLPTRSLVDDLTVLDFEDQEKSGRLHRYLQRHSEDSAPREHTLIVDTGTSMERTVYREGRRIFPLQERRAGKDRSHLYRGDIIVTTLDKFIYRFFGFAWGRKSYIYPLRINRPDTLVCFDEAHSYDATAFTNFSELVKTLYEKNVGVVAMTATLPEPFRRHFEFLRVESKDGKLEWLDFTTDGVQANQSFTKKLAYLPDVTSGTKEENQEDREAVFSGRVEKLVSLATERWQERPRRLIVAAESVRGAVQIYCQLKAVDLGDLIPQKTLFLYHGRLDGKQRALVYQRLKDLDGQDGSAYVLVTTSAIEVGCDLDAEILLTEVCLPDSLVQRAGRCNRRGKFNTTAEVVVVGSRIPKFVRTLPEEQEQKFRTLLQQRNGEVLTPAFVKDMLNCLERPLLIDPRAKTAFEMLYEYVYEFALENQPLHERGFVATRSWEPAVPLVIRSGKKIDEIRVEVSRLASTKVQGPLRGVIVEEWQWGEDSRKWNWTPVQRRGGSLYEREIRVNVTDSTACDYTTELGFIKLPKVFSYASRGGAYEVRLGYFLPDESVTDSDAATFLDGNAKKAKRPDVFFRYLSDPQLVETGESAGISTKEDEGTETKALSEGEEGEE